MSKDAAVEPKGEDGLHLPRQLHRGQKASLERAGKTRDFGLCSPTFWEFSNRGTYFFDRAQTLCPYCLDISTLSTSLPSSHLYPLHILFSSHQYSLHIPTLSHLYSLHICTFFTSRLSRIFLHSSTPFTPLLCAHLYPLSISKLFTSHPWWCIVVMMHCCGDVLLWNVLLWWCIDVMMYCRDDVLLWWCIVVMMYCCDDALLWWCIVVKCIVVMMYCCDNVLLWWCIVVHSFNIS